MGHQSLPERLALRWAELCADPSLHDLPYKIELNAFGNIEMSPAKTRHARLQGFVAGELHRLLPGGAVMTECAVLTAIGVRVPDVVWASAAFMQRHGHEPLLPRAPELCVEVRSAGNSDEEMALKRDAYLAAGAEEVWVVKETGDWRVFDATGECTTSRFVAVLNLPPPGA
jgi:Uma2 family endonuclease